MASGFDFGFANVDEDIEEYNRAFEAEGIGGCKRLIEAKHEEWKTIPLTIAVIGNSGVGKSSFINAIRDMTADDDGAAQVDVNECTDAIRAYPHPSNPLLSFWDLPGVGTDRFPKVTYLDQIELNRYDFFLLLSATRFTENDTWLGKEIHSRYKKFFFVRTKLGNDITNNKQSHPKTHNEAELINRVRKTTLDCLERPKVTNCSWEAPKFYLIDSYQKQSFDFDDLRNTLVDDFPTMKRSAMILSMCAFSEGMIKRKAQQLGTRIWKKALFSAGLAAIPIPCLSLLFDALIVNSESQFCFSQLGLDDESLKRHATLTSNDYTQLKAIVDRTFDPSFFSVEGLKTFVQGAQVVAHVAGKGTAQAATSMVAKGVAQLVNCFPVMGSLIASTVSFGGTYYVLKLILARQEEVALQVVRYVGEHTVRSGEILPSEAGNSQQFARDDYALVHAPDIHQSGEARDLRDLDEVANQETANAERRRSDEDVAKDDMSGRRTDVELVDDDHVGGLEESNTPNMMYKEPETDQHDRTEEREDTDDEREQGPRYQAEDGRQEQNSDQQELETGAKQEGADANVKTDDEYANHGKNVDATKPSAAEVSNPAQPRCTIS